MDHSTTVEQEPLIKAPIVHYKHQQWGIEMVAVLTIGALISVLLAPYFPEPYWAHTLAVCFLLVAWLFSSLTTTIDDEHFSWHFGPGLIRNHVMLNDIRSAHAIRVRWYRSWGMAPTSRGWLYSVSGRKAVLIKCTDDRHLLIGSDEPDALVKVLLTRFSCR